MSRALRPVLDPDVRAAPPSAPGTDADRTGPLSSGISAAQPAWMARYRLSLLGLDLAAMMVATLTGYRLRFGPEASGATALDYLVVGALLIVGWVVALQYAGGYEIRYLGAGPEEAKRVLRGSAIAAGALAVACYATHTEVARGYVIGVLPIGVVLLLLGRLGLRQFVRVRREHGRWAHRILVAGTREAVLHLLDATRRAPHAGLQVVGVCVDDAAPGSELAPGVPVVGGVAAAADAARSAAADVVAVAGSGLAADAVRRLGWQLEGTARGLVIAPALTEIAGPRVHVSPVVGLPLMWLDRPQLGRLPRLLKRALDLTGGLVLITAATPIYLATAIAIKVSSRGPVLFKQARLGQGGVEFTMLKFRSMYRDAEARRRWEHNEQDGGGVLFKMRRDPRVTPVGRFIRALSIDELPQLLHVLSGRMSLVGPRPLAAADSVYSGPARRRLLVRPGLTGLWQVSGRSELSWDDAVRLDLYYVENWSLGMDLSILARTVFAVLSRKGAY